MWHLYVVDVGGTCAKQTPMWSKRVEVCLAWSGVVEAWEGLSGAVVALAHALWGLAKPH